MRVLLDHPFPFSITHGGFQTQIEQTLAALRGIGLDAEPMRWWDDAQRGDIIHYFGRPVASYIHAAHHRGTKVVMAELLTGTGSRSWNTLRAQRAMIRLSERILPAAFAVRLAWEAYRMADAAVALTAWEARLMQYLFEAPPGKVHVIPNGVEMEFFRSPPLPRGKWMVCTATITERKRVLELAEAAVEARTPLWVLGKPYSDADPYGNQFLNLAKSAPEFIRYEGAVNDRAKLAAIYREARGFVLLSTMESLSLSALEAAACECPLLLSDLPWARTVFNDKARYCKTPAARGVTAACLREFYDAAPGLPVPSRPLTWEEVARQLRSVYEHLLTSSR